MELGDLYLAGGPSERSAPSSAPVASAPWTERRAFYRKAVNWPARCRARNDVGALQEHLASIRDISQGGARLRLRAELPVGGLLELEVRQQGLVFRCVATILGRTRTEEGFEFRVRFDNLTMVARDALLMLTAGGIGMLH